MRRRGPSRAGGAAAGPRKPPLTAHDSENASALDKRSVRAQIEATRRQSHLMGYVVTEFSDLYWEANGLLDFSRAPKVYFDRCRTINTPGMIMPLPVAHPLNMP